MVAFDGIEVNFSNMGLFYTDLPWLHPKRVISTYELIYCVEGTFHIVEGGVTYYIQPGTLFLLPPHTMHYGIKKTDAPVKFYWLHFYCKGFEKLQLERTYAIENTEVDGYIFRELNSLQIQTEKKILQDLKMVEILLKMRGRQQSTPNKLLSEVKEFVRINADKSIHIQDVADKFHYSAGHLSRLFTKNTGMPLRNYIINARISYIKNLLLNSSSSIKEISALCDFCDENIFVKFFKHNTGITPTGYRNEHGNTHTNSH